MLERLVGDSLQRGVIVETEVTSVDNVVGASLLRELVERLEVTCARRVCQGPIELAHYSRVSRSYLERRQCIGL